MNRRLPGPLEGYYRRRVAELARMESRATGEPLAEWAQRRIRLDGKPFTFVGHEYLRAIYDDPAAHIVLTKAAQIGGSVWSILRSIHACLSGLNVIYFFPTRTDVLEFSKARVAPLLAGNPFLARQITDTDTAGLKRIGAGHLYLRGMQSPVGMKSVPADMLVFDELDEASPDSKALARERLAHSSYKRIIELSNPSIPHYGIDESFHESDQRHWTIRCVACGSWTALDREFPTRLGQDVPVLRQRPDGTWFRACAKCGAELNVDSGEWVADYPDRPVHGYLISQLFSAMVDPGEIMHEYQTTRFPERFYNLKIGIAWADTQHRVDKGSVLKLCSGAEMLDASDVPCTMGVDTGKDLHVVISRWMRKQQKREVVYLGVHREYAELDDLMRRFKVRCAVIDAMPELHATRDLVNRSRGIVWMNYFQENQRGHYNWDSQANIVSENRTEALDASRKVLRDGRISLPRRLPLVETFAEHIAADTKRLVEDQETGAQSYRYVRAGVDHFSLAFTYDCIAWTRDAEPWMCRATVRPNRGEWHRKPLQW